MIKVAIVVDEITHRDNSIYLLENLLTLFSEAQVYTLLHRPKKVLGQLQRTKVTSSFLSRVLGEDEELSDRPWLLPPALNSFNFSENIQLIISLSSGWAHAISVPSSAKHLSIICDWKKIARDKTPFWKKIFLPYSEKLRRKKLQKLDKLFVINQALNGELNIEAEKIKAAFKTDDYFFIPDDQFQNVYAHYFCYCDDLSVEEARSIIETVKELDEKVLFFGEDKHLESLKTESNHYVFLGDQCAGDASHHMAYVKAVICPEKSYFPEKALGALTCGRPVILEDTLANRDYLSEEVALFGELTEKIKEMESKYSQFDRHALRRQGLRFNARLFKAKVDKTVRDFNLS